MYGDTGGEKAAGPDLFIGNIVVHGKFAFVPNTGASPNGPVRFDVNTQSLMSVIDIANRKDANESVSVLAFRPGLRRKATRGPLLN